MIHVYILRTSRDTLYIGQTNDLAKRMQQHRAHKGSKYLKAFSDFELVYAEEMNTRSEALKREAELKKLTKTEKEKFLRVAGEKVDFNIWTTDTQIL